ncbi:hypothetical protein EJ03DRAFT_124722 [Teratosphaeria nubilosa]|uniref:Uncharacterized protein n=1 Tax=Teratosphaeria nubilosa TaxID=161662 RepID=A0A6G1LKW9_9PEZI|nr:hypothetical protein EJ03DRAFT_124722 [Teratosphaeria nubilosa]
MPCREGQRTEPLCHLLTDTVIVSTVDEIKRKKCRKLRLDPEQKNGVKLGGEEACLQSAKNAYHLASQAVQPFTCRGCVRRKTQQKWTAVKRPWMQGQGEGLRYSLGGGQLWIHGRNGRGASTSCQAEHCHEGEQISILGARFACLIDFVSCDGL